MTMPTPSETLPSRKNHTGLCPNPECARYVRFELMSDERFPQLVWPRYATSSGSHRGIYLDVWQCPSCHDTAVVFERIRENEDEPELMLAWPRRSPRDVEQSVPTEIRELFLEGGSTEHIGSLRAAAAMYRACVEAICRERGVTGKDLYNKIDDLKTKGVADEIVEDLHQARMLGNWSLHDGLEFSSEEVADVADLIYEALFQIYVQPGQRAALRASRKAKRDAHRAAKRKTTGTP